MFNEATVVGGVVAGLLADFPLVVCVDDGSSDDSGAVARAAGARVVTHPINLGQGAALQTGIEYGLRVRPACAFFLTFDADGQHRVDDARRMVEAARAGEADVILGSRFLSAAGTDGTLTSMKASRRFLLKGAVAFTRLTTGMRLTDAHNGLRVLTRPVAELIDIRLHGMAHASELLGIVARSGHTWTEVPVTIDYTEYSMAKGQSSVNAVNIVLDLMLGRLARGRH
jgi:polyprenyl-phospho-N-acetylgalactosaminyl synthase